MTENAALTAEPALKNDALALLHTIDAEEFNQRRLETTRGLPGGSAVGPTSAASMARPASS